MEKRICYKNKFKNEFKVGNQESLGEEMILCLIGESVVMSCFLTKNFLEINPNFNFHIFLIANLILYRMIPNLLNKIYLLKSYETLSRMSRGEHIILPLKA